MSEYLIIDGVKTSDFGMYVINSNSYKTNWIPSNKISAENLPLQIGKRFVDSHHNEKKLEYSCYIEDGNNHSINVLSKIIAKNKQVSIVKSTEPHKRYKAVLVSEVDLNLYLNGGTFTLQYVAHFPYAESRFTTGDIIDNGLIYNLDYYYNSGLLYNENNDIFYEYNDITTDTDFFIHNGSNISGSKPNIILNGSADSITIKRYLTEDRIEEIDRVSYGEFDGKLEINCLLLDTFLDGSVNNATFDGRYFELDVGEIKYIYSNKNCIISGKNIILDNNASSVDDYYNGYYISLINNKDRRVYYRIIDYDGATKTAITESNIDAVDGYFAIYDIQQGFNYFTIEGTNMNIDSLKFDFRFLYV